MSMLAERKRKQKWSLNPRGNAWAQDTNKFGQKLLESMGWKEGKGLGAREDGLKEHIKVSYKNDSKGFGFKDKDVWTEHEDNFSALLQDLSNSEVAVKIKTNTDDYKPKSLEEKSLTSRVRVHYHKFTRGKDLSRYSEKDLANVFGKRSLKDKKVREDENSNKAETDSKTGNHGVITVEGGSMIDYFKSKMSTFYRNSPEVKDDDLDETVRPGFGFSCSFNDCTNLNTENNGKTENCSFSFESENESLQNLEEISGEKKEKDTGKKKSKKRKLSDNSEEKTPKKKKHRIVAGGLETEDTSSSAKKKKHKDKTEIGDNFGVSNPAFDPLFTKEIPIKKHSLNTIKEDEEVEESLSNSHSEDEDETRKKKRKLENSLEIEECKRPKKKNQKWKEEDIIFENPNFKMPTNSEELAENKNNNIYEIKTKKKKNKKKKNHGIENPVFNSCLQETEVKNKENYSNGIENPIFEDNVSPTNSKRERERTQKYQINQEKNDLFEINSKVLEESQKNDDLIDETFQKELANKIENGFENPVFESLNNSRESAEAVDNNIYEVKNKKKKKKGKKENGIENPTFEENSQSVENDFEIAKKKTKTSESLVSEENITTSTTSSECILNVSDEPDIMLNVSIGPPEYLKQMESNNSRDNSIKSVRKNRKSVRFSDINDQREIPNRLEEMNGLVNEGFDYQKDKIENEMQKISEKFDSFKAKIENNINESKDFNIWTIGEPVTEGDNEKLEHGTKLRLKHAEFASRTAYYLRRNNSESFAKRSYKHLIKGDIVLHFKNTNLHEIHGYGKQHKKDI
ncbi:uncharacterized protein PF07_0021 [Agrilus planipennis]|uniref:Uncharacterized protein PF07_0021 n=1 Tax=Agrilus planipennis TaxID=224129 RepID=A0A1W4XQS6_AGRPL|nr:uncharacterized protein PF07_0021 [Agrilus planipennis]